MGLVLRVRSNRFGAIAGQLPGLARAERQQAAQEILELAQAIVPVDTGELRDSIHTVEGDNQTAVVADAGHAAYVELGTYKMAAQPYLTPAAEAVWPQYKASLQRAIASVR